MNRAAPAWGAGLRGEWDLDPEFLTVNHGSFGATPRVVLEAQSAWRERMERQPTRFFMDEYGPALRAAAARLAAFVGAEGIDLVFVENATAGCNAVLASMPLGPGDEVVVLDQGYGAVVRAARIHAARAGARLVEVELPFPAPEDDAVVSGLAAAFGPRTRCAVLDHITSPSALLLPIARMVAACRAAGVPVLVDGAHGPGNVALDLVALDADFYVGNCHKWLAAPKGCGFLWARRDRQAGLLPTTLSHGADDGFLGAFDWTGTRDPSAWLAIGAALDFHTRLGGAALRARNAALAAEAASWLAGRLGTEVGAVGAPHAMAVVRLPGTGRIDEGTALQFRATLLRRGTDAPVNAIRDRAWIRLSAHAYNEMSDFERLAEMLSPVFS